MPTYFSEARGLRKGYGLPELRIIVRDLYTDLVANDHLKEWIGYDCVDAGRVTGTAVDPGRQIVRQVGRRDVWPTDPVAGAWSEDAIFDFLQFIATKVSSPVDGSGYYHQYAGCGWHDQTFQQEPARTEFISEVNSILSRYSDGWEMTADLQIVERAPSGLSDLLAAKVPLTVDASVRSRVDSAISKFRSRSSSRDDRRDAVRDLGDVFERLRKVAKQHLGADESDLFNILNNFDIRHNNLTQKSDYDVVWLTGLFYYYLTMIHVLARLVGRETKASN